jgi:hypothetical protein
MANCASSTSGEGLRHNEIMTRHIEAHALSHELTKARLEQVVEQNH